MSATCINCNSARLAEFGNRVGSLWCFLKSKPVLPLSKCPYFVSLNESSKAVGSVARSLVKSATKSQYETKSIQSAAFSGVVDAG